MSEAIENEIKSTEQQIQALNVRIKEFVSDLDENDMDIRYTRLLGFGQDGIRLHVELMKLKTLKDKYDI